jgi:hypothetical protein
MRDKNVTFLGNFYNFVQFHQFHLSNSKQVPRLYDIEYNFFVTYKLSNMFIKTNLTFNISVFLQTLFSEYKFNSILHSRVANIFQQLSLITARSFLNLFESPLKNLHNVDVKKERKNQGNKHLFDKVKKEELIIRQVEIMQIFIVTNSSDIFKCLLFCLI